MKKLNRQILSALLALLMFWNSCPISAFSADLDENVPETTQATEVLNTEPKATEPKATKPKVTEPKATEPKATEPKATEPKATEPKATEPKATEPVATEPKATEPEATEPEVTEPEVTEPADNCPYCDDTTAEDGEVLHADDCNTNFAYNGAVDVNKYVKLSAAAKAHHILVSADPESADGVRFTYDEFGDGTIMHITGWYWDVETTALWYHVKLHTGAFPAGDGQRQWPATAWILNRYTDPSVDYGNSLTVVYPCAACNEFNCTAEHIKCEICEAYDCTAEHIKCEICEAYDCTAEHIKCEICEAYDCVAEHKLCKLCQKYDCTIDHKAEPPRILMTSTGPKVTSAYAVNIGKKATFNDNMSSSNLFISAEPKGESDWSSAQRIAFSEVKDLVVEISDVVEVTYKNAATYWYKVVAAEGHTLPDAISAKPWVFQNIVGDDAAYDTLIIQAAPENTCKCCDNCTGDEECQCGCGSCAFCEPENTCACCEACTGKDGCECECGECDFCEVVIPELNDETTGVTVYAESFPEGVTLSVSETDVTAQLAEFGVSAEKQVFGLDISLLDADNAVTQPDGTVLVKIPVDVAVGTKIGILHTHGDKTTYMGMRTVQNDGTVEFFTSGFSTFAGFTVDFHYNGIDHSIDGLTSIKLSELFEILKIDRDVLHVTDVKFTNTDLVDVRKIDDDWMLESKQAFETNELLTITFYNGEIIVINVTDDQIVSNDKINGEYRFNVFSGKVTYTHYSKSGITVKDGTAYRHVMTEKGTQSSQSTDSLNYIANVGVASNFVYSGNTEAWYYLTTSSTGSVSQEGTGVRVYGKASGTPQFHFYEYSRSLFLGGVPSKDYSGTFGAYLSAVRQNCGAVVVTSTVDRTVVLKVQQADGSYSTIATESGIKFPNNSDVNHTLGVTLKSNQNAKYDLVLNGTNVGNTGYVSHSNGTYTIELTLQSYTATAKAGVGVESVSGGGTYQNSLTSGSTPTFTATLKNGYQWTGDAGWYNGTEKVSSAQNYAFTMPASDVTYTANAVPIPYTATFVDGATSTEVGFTIEDALTLPTISKAGHTLKWKITSASGNWTNGTEYTNFDIAAGMYGNVTFTAQWTPISYNITWKNYDGTTLKTDSVPYGTVPTYTGSIPTKEGNAQYSYTFNGWNKEIVAVTGEATYTATFEQIINKYTIKFLNDDGTELQSGELEYGDMPQYDGEEPKKAADAQYTYEFEKWSPAIAAVTGDATYTATYKTTTNKYTIKFVNDDGSLLQSGKVAYGDTPAYISDEPTKAATTEFTYTFAGWTPTITPVTGEATYTAKFDSSARKYKVEVRLNPDHVTYTGLDGFTTVGGHLEKELEYGTTVKPVFTVKEGYYIQEILVDNVKQNSQNGEISFEVLKNAVVEVKTAPSVYKLTWVYGNGDENVEIDVAYGTAITKPSDPVKTGYDFDGWDTEIPVTMPARDVTITAEWKIKQIPVTFKHYYVENEKEFEIYGQDPTTHYIEYGKKIAVADFAEYAEEFDAYAYVGPKVEKDHTVTEDENQVIILYYQEKTATFTYVSVAVGTDGNGNLIYGGTVSPESETVRILTGNAAGATATAEVGYSFAGWYATADCSGEPLSKTEILKPAKNAQGYYESATYYAKFVKTLYTVTFKTDANMDHSTADYTMGDTVTLAKPEKTGYICVGWYWDADNDGEIDENEDDTLYNDQTPFAMPSENVTLIAQWERNVFTITFKDDTGAEFETMRMNEQYGETVIIPAAPAKTNARFQGWCYDADGDGTIDSVYKADDLFVMPENDVTLTASWVYAEKLVITANGTTGDTFFFKVMGTTENVNLTVSVPANSSVTINGLFHDTYRVEELDDWSWTYAAVEAKEATLSVDDKVIENKVIFDMSNSVSCWLHD